MSRSRQQQTDDDDPQPKRLIYEKKERLQQIRDRYWEEGVEGQRSNQTKRWLATVMLQFYDVLHEYRDETVLSDDDFPDISPIRERIGEQTTVIQTSKRVGGGQTVETVPAINELSEAYLIDLSEQLDDLAKKLGFSAQPITQRPIYHVGIRNESEYDEPVVDSIAKPLAGDDDGISGIRYSKLYHDWYSRVATGNPNDYVIAISADPRSTGVSGTGKTTLGGGLAKDWFDHSESGYDADVQYTLDASTLAYDMYNETDELSVLIGDEMQGTPATSGLNAKRSMKGEALDTINAIAAGRSDRKTVILIVQDLKALNKDALTFVDSWLLIRNDREFIATHYEVAPDVFDLQSRQTRTPGVERITWNSLPKDDPDYRVMEEKKARAKKGQREYQTDEEEEDDEISKDARDDKIRDLYEQGIPQKKIAGAFGLTQQSVSNIVNETED